MSDFRPLLFWRLPSAERPVLQSLWRNKLHACVSRSLRSDIRAEAHQGPRRGGRVGGGLWIPGGRSDMTPSLTCHVLNFPSARILERCTSQRWHCILYAKQQSAVDASSSFQRLAQDLYVRHLSLEIHAVDTLLCCCGTPGDLLNDQTLPPTTGLSNHRDTLRTESAFWSAAMSGRVPQGVSDT